MSGLDWLTPEIRDELISGVIVTVAITILTSLTSFAVGLLAAIGRRSRRRITSRVAGCFVEIFRNVPALILVIFFAFAVPNVLPPDVRRTVLFANGFVDAVGEITNLPLPYYAFAAVTALTLNTGAHLAEIIRSGMDAVPTERIEVARSLGASARTSYVTITIPDGLRIAFPGVTSRLVHNLKNTALVSFVAVPDVFLQIQGAITETFAATELLVFAAVLYLALATLLEFGLKRIETALWRGRAIDRRADV